MHDGLSEASPRPPNQVTREPVRGSLRLSRDHDLSGPELVQGVGDRLEWIRVSDQPLRPDPGGA
jgi:hypothetical protein